MTDVNLTVKGDIEVLRLQPGDTIVVTLDRPATSEKAAAISEQTKARFPGHEVVIVSGVRLSVQRSEAA